MYMSIHDRKIIVISSVPMHARLGGHHTHGAIDARCVHTNQNVLLQLIDARQHDLWTPLDKMVTFLLVIELNCI